MAKKYEIKINDDQTIAFRSLDIIPQGLNSQDLISLFADFPAYLVQWILSKNEGEEKDIVREELYESLQGEFANILRWLKPDHTAKAEDLQSALALKLVTQNERDQVYRLNEDMEWVKNSK